MPGSEGTDQARWHDLCRQGGADKIPSPLACGERQPGRIPCRTEGFESRFRAIARQAGATGGELRCRRIEPNDQEDEQGPGS